MNANKTKDKRQLQAPEACNCHLRDSVKTGILHRRYQKYVTVRCAAGHSYTSAIPQNISVHNMNIHNASAFSTLTHKNPSYTRVLCQFSKEPFT
jgi:hypothetical protein